MITLNVPRIAQIMGVKHPYTYLVKSGFTPQTAKDLLAGKTRRLDFAHLEKLCRIFNCEPHDLYDYRPDKRQAFVGQDGLAFLTKPQADASIHNIIEGLSLKEMEALLADMSQRYKAA